MAYTKDFSVIIPCWRGAIKFLPKLFSSIPDQDGIEIIVVDNSKDPVQREEIQSDREIVFLHSAPERHAGGGRNDGILVAKGKWLLFADADDYYTSDAFEIYYSMINTDAEIVYTGMGGVYEDTGEPSNRGEMYAQLVHSYCLGETGEYSLRFGFASPCCKMVSHALVERENLRYDEIRAGNDMFFSVTAGCLATKITAVDTITYIATVNRGSLTQHRDYETIKARLFAMLRTNKFLREHGFSKHQKSIMNYLYECRHFGILKMWEFLVMTIKYRQNPFIGWKNWSRSFGKVKNNEKTEAKYIVK